MYVAVPYDQAWEIGTDVFDEGGREAMPKQNEQALSPPRFQNGKIKRSFFFFLPFS